MASARELVSTIPGLPDPEVKIIDVEYSWNTGHEDLEATAVAGAVVRNGTPQDPFYDDNHGTAVLGVLVADADTQGVTGVASDATIGMVNAYNVEARIRPGERNRSGAHEHVGGRRDVD